jgi:hypothetical protein
VLDLEDGSFKTDLGDEAFERCDEPPRASDASIVRRYRLGFA